MSVVQRGGGLECSQPYGVDKIELWMRPGLIFCSCLGFALAVNRECSLEGSEKMYIDPLRGLGGGRNVVILLRGGSEITAFH